MQGSSSVTVVYSFLRAARARRGDASASPTARGSAARNHVAKVVAHGRGRDRSDTIGSDAHATLPGWRRARVSRRCRGPFVLPASIARRASEHRDFAPRAARRRGVAHPVAKELPARRAALVVVASGWISTRAERGGLGSGPRRRRATAFLLERRPRLPILPAVGETQPNASTRQRGEPPSSGPARTPYAGRVSLVRWTLTRLLSAAAPRGGHRPSRRRPGAGVRCRAVAHQRPNSYSQTLAAAPRDPRAAASHRGAPRRRRGIAAGDPIEVARENARASPRGARRTGAAILGVDTVVAWTGQSRKTPSAEAARSTLNGSGPEPRRRQRAALANRPTLRWHEARE